MGGPWHCRVSGQARDTALGVDPLESIDRLLRDLRTRRSGLSDREAARRLVVLGPNELVRRRGRGWLRDLVQQLVHPLALLLWLAAGLAQISGTTPLAIAIVIVILLSALFAFLQERHAEQAVEALSAYLPLTVHVVREETARQMDVRELVPGDVIMIDEGDRVSADARLLSGSVETDVSTLTGESLPVLREPDPFDAHGPILEARDVVFSGTNCTQGGATAVVFNTGMHTELGRIAALSQRVGHDERPLEKQVKQVARLIALVAVGMGVAFIPLGTLLAGLSLGDALNFAIGLLVANVPEGLLPTITLALAVGVRVLARKGVLVKRISAVETLGSTSVICTDKTGTLTLNRMRVVRGWTSQGIVHLRALLPEARPEPAETRMARAVVACNNAQIGLSAPGGSTPAHGSSSAPDKEIGDPTELALLHMARSLGVDVAPGGSGQRMAQFHFDPALRRMSTVDRAAGKDPGGDADLVRVRTKGAPEEILPLCTRLGTQDGRDRPLTRRDQEAFNKLVTGWAEEGLCLLAVAERDLDEGDLAGLTRVQAERDLTLLGVTAMLNPPRLEVADASPAVHPRTSCGSPMPCRTRGTSWAMTGDGVNDAPALRRADIGVAMGQSGTEVAREAATMVLTDDNLASIVTAVEAGRQVYDNVRKFIVCIFAHATPEVVPFLVYALSGGRIPLPLTVMLILAIDLGTETLPALALGREPAEPGLMERPPRRRHQNVIDAPMLARAWGLLGGVSALLVMTIFLVTLRAGGWHLGADVSLGPLTHVWQQATTMSFLGIVACQIGTAMASRTERASLFQVGSSPTRCCCGDSPTRSSSLSPW